jgi:deoxyadenosine/deoxycytidine kinase
MTSMPNDDRKRLDSHDQKIDSLERKFDEFLKSMSERFDRWDDLYYAFIGNKIDNKAGILNRIIHLEAKAEELEKRMEKVEASNTKIIAYAVATSFAAAVVWHFVSPALGM